jgi:hypothetical protein
MDAFISAKAMKTISATARILHNSTSSGYLTGHKRGPRYIVEDVLMFSEKTGFSVENFNSVNNTLDDEVIGFVMFNPKNKQEDAPLFPWSYRKLYVEVRKEKKKSLSFQAFVIEHEKAFSLTKVKTEISSIKRPE